MTETRLKRRRAVTVVAAALATVSLVVAASVQASYFNPSRLYACGSKLAFQFKSHHHYSEGTVKGGKLSGHLVTGRYKRHGKKIIGLSGYLKKHHESLLVQKSDLALVNSKGHLTHTKCAVQTSTLPGALASMGAEPAPSIFGINHGTFDSVSLNYTKDEPAAQSLGSRWDHQTLSPATATGNFQSSDYWVKQARSHHMGIILSFGGIASACSISPTPSNVAGCPPTTPADLSNYQSYIERILARYHNVVDYYESWKEPNHAGQWGGTVNPAQYAALLKAQNEAFQTFNSEHPNSGPGGSNMKLLFGSANGFTTTPPSKDIAALPFVHQVLDALGSAKPFDGVALHAYRYPPSNGPDDSVQDYVGTLSYPNQGCVPTPYGSCRLTWSQELSAYEQEFTDHGDGQPPMWLTEFGWPGGGDCSSLPRDYCLSTNTQDADLKAAYADLLKLSFVQGALWFNVRDYQPGVLSPDPAFFYHYGLLNYDYSHKPAADDFKALAAAHPNS